MDLRFSYFLVFPLLSSIFWTFLYYIFSLWSRKRYHRQESELQQAMDNDLKKMLEKTDKILKETKEANDDLEKTLKYGEDIGLTDEDKAKNEFGMGIIKFSNKQYSAAMIHFEKAIELNPNYAEAYNNWGVVLDELGKYEEAIEKYEKAKALAKEQGLISIVETIDQAIALAKSRRDSL